MMKKKHAEYLKYVIIKFYSDFFCRKRKLVQTNKLKLIH